MKKCTKGVEKSVQKVKISKSVVESVQLITKSVQRVENVQKMNKKRTRSIQGVIQRCSLDSC